MEYFTIKRFLFLVPSNDCAEEFEKIDKFIEILNKSGIGKIIEQEQKKYKKSNAGNPEYNPFNLMATIIYWFSKFKSTVREIEIRINRSIQVEGAFGQIKQNMQYTRIRRRGLEKVSCEIMLMCLGANIRKYFSTLNGKN